jgi:hypothetical protein
LISSLIIQKIDFVEMNETVASLRSPMRFFGGKKEKWQTFGSSGRPSVNLLGICGRLFVGELISHEADTTCIRPSSLAGARHSSRRWLLKGNSEFSGGKAATISGLPPHQDKWRASDQRRPSGGWLVPFPFCLQNDEIYTPRCGFIRWNRRQVSIEFQWGSELNFVLRGQTAEADNRLVIAMEEKELGRSLKGQQADEQEEKMEIGEWSHQFSFSLIGEISKQLEFISSNSSRLTGRFTVFHS